jgi:hypothetical protein
MPPPKSFGGWQVEGLGGEEPLQLDIGGAHGPFHPLQARNAGLCLDHGPDALARGALPSPVFMYMTAPAWRTPSKQATCGECGRAPKPSAIIGWCPSAVTALRAAAQMGSIPEMRELMNTFMGAV